MKHIITRGMKVRINDDLYRTSNAHSCATRMYELKGMVFEVVGASPTEITIRDEEYKDGSRTWMFHPADVTPVIAKVEKGEPVLFDVNNLM